MSHNAVERYASAVFEQLMSESDAEVTRFVDDSESFIQLVEKSEALKGFFSSPAFSEPEKKDLFAVLSERTGYSAHFRSLFGLLIEHRRTGLLPEIRRSIRKYQDHASGTGEAVIFTPFSFDESELLEISVRLAEITGCKKVRLVQKIDPALVGGAQIRMGDRVYDASLKSMMKDLKKNIMEIC
ncbi:MAG TPA: ATP synthase F1 subunit delta [bacterium]|nr:ATP synthase F1 subunit delta [bacterium]